MKKFVIIENITGASCPDCGPNIKRDLNAFETRADAQKVVDKKTQENSDYFADIIEIEV